MICQVDMVKGSVGAQIVISSLFIFSRSGALEPSIRVLAGFNAWWLHWLVNCKGRLAIGGSCLNSRCGVLVYSCPYPALQLVHCICLPSDIFYKY